MNLVTDGARARTIGVRGIKSLDEHACGIRNLFLRRIAVFKTSQELIHIQIGIERTRRIEHRCAFEKIIFARNERTALVRNPRFTRIVDRGRPGFEQQRPRLLARAVNELRAQLRRHERAAERAGEHPPADAIACLDNKNAT